MSYKVVSAAEEALNTIQYEKDQSKMRFQLRHIDPVHANMRVQAGQERQNSHHDRRIHEKHDDRINNQFASFDMAFLISDRKFYPINYQLAQIEVLFRSCSIS